MFRCLAFVFGGVLAGLCGGYFLFSYAETITNDHSARIAGAHSSLINPLLECAELPESVSLGERVRLQSRIEQLISSRIEEKRIASGAIYFRDLNNGTWFGVNEDTPFNPASLLKIPLAMSFFIRAEDDPAILTQQFEHVKISDAFEAHQAFGSASSSMQNGAIYSILDVIKLMLQASSNEATYVLAEAAGDQFFRAYVDLGLPQPKSNEDHLIDVHTYASFFRVLYNATYLNHQNSQKMLEILTQSSFRSGIVAGVPAEIKVAHKFGTRSMGGQKLKQLHDCGIVYAESHPYVLCIMTQGENFDSLAAFIKDVSALIYTEVVKEAII